MRLEPFRQIVRDRPRHFGVAQAVRRKIADEPLFALTEASRAKAVAVTARQDRVRAPPLYQGQAGQDAAAGYGRAPVLGDPPVERRPMPEHRVDMAGDVRPVL